MDTKLIPEFENSLFNSPTMDIITDFLEIGIDSIMEEELIKDIPILGTIVKLGGIFQNIYDRNLLRQTFVFINSFRNNTIDTEKLDKYRRILLTNPKRAEQELGRVLIYLNRFIDLEKSKFLANAYRYYCYNYYNWDKYCELAEVIDRLFISDISILKDIYLEEGVDIEKMTYKHDRIISIGLLQNIRMISASNEEIDKLFDEPFSANVPQSEFSEKINNEEENENRMFLTDLGKLFYEVYINGL